MGAREPRFALPAAAWRFPIPSRTAERTIRFCAARPPYWRAAQSCAPTRRAVGTETRRATVIVNETFCGSTYGSRLPPRLPTLPIFSILRSSKTARRPRRSTACPSGPASPPRRGTAGLSGRGNPRRTCHGPPRRRAGRAAANSAPEEVFHKEVSITANMAGRQKRSRNAKSDPVPVKND